MFQIFIFKRKNSLFFLFRNVLFLWFETGAFFASGTFAFSLKQLFLIHFHALVKKGQSLILKWEKKFSFSFFQVEDLNKKKKPVLWKKRKVRFPKPRFWTQLLSFFQIWNKLKKDFYEKLYYLFINCSCCSAGLVYNHSSFINWN